MFNRRNIQRYLLFCIFPGLFFTLSNSQADNITVGFYNYPPLMIESDKTGIYQDIFDELEKLTNDTFTIQYYPYPRLTLLFNKNEIDLEPGVFPGWVQNQDNPGVFSHSFGIIEDSLVFGPGKRFSVNKPLDLAGKILGLVRGYSYPDLRELLDNGTIGYGNAADEHQLIEMLANGRFNQILVNKAVAQYFIFKNSKYKQLEIGDPLGTFEVRMRIQPSKKDFLSRINTAILSLQKSQKIKEIYAKYGVTMD